MSMMVSFVLSFFPRDVLDEILNLIESVSEDFPSYSCSQRRVAVYILVLIKRSAIIKEDRNINPIVSRLETRHKL